MPLYQTLLYKIHKYFNFCSTVHLSPDMHGAPLTSTKRNTNWLNHALPGLILLIHHLLTPEGHVLMPLDWLSNNS